MTSWPTVDRASLLLPTLPGHDDALWDTLIGLAGLRPGEWTLIGGQGVLARHRARHHSAPCLDRSRCVGQRSIVTGGVSGFVAAIESRGFGLEGTSPEGLAHRYRRGGVSVDVLAPEGLGPRSDLTTTPPGRTLQVPGGTQALRRTELLPVHTTTCRGQVPRPSLQHNAIAPGPRLSYNSFETPRNGAKRSSRERPGQRRFLGVSRSTGSAGRVTPGLDISRPLQAGAVRFLRGSFRAGLSATPGRGAGNPGHGGGPAEQDPDDDDEPVGSLMEAAPRFEDG